MQEVRSKELDTANLAFHDNSYDCIFYSDIIRSSYIATGFKILSAQT